MFFFSPSKFVTLAHSHLRTCCARWRQYDYCERATSPRTTSAFGGVRCRRHFRGDGQDLAQRLLGCVRPFVKLILVVRSLRVFGEFPW